MIKQNFFQQNVYYLTLTNTMDLNRLTRDADDLIRKVVSRYNQLYVPAGRISQVELDLMLDDMRRLYDTFKTIGQVNLTLQNTATKPEVSVNAAFRDEPRQADTYSPSQGAKLSDKAEQMPVTTQVEPEIDAFTEPITEKVVEPDSENDINTEKNADFLDETEFDAEPVTESPLPAKSEISYNEPFVQPKTEELKSTLNPDSPQAMLADKYSNGTKSLSETMASSQAQAVMGSRLQFQPISDLSSGIGLNDKFSFISELFDNDNSKYDEAISRINKAVNLDEANWILQKYHSAEWDQKNDSLARLKDFVKRRFI